MTTGELRLLDAFGGPLTINGTLAHLTRAAHSCAVQETHMETSLSCLTFWCEWALKICSSHTAMSFILIVADRLVVLNDLQVIPSQ